MYAVVYTYAASGYICYTQYILDIYTLESSAYKLEGPTVGIYDMSRKQRIKTLQKELDHTVVKITDIGDNVKKKNKELQHEHHVITHCKISKARLTTDKMEMDKDVGARPSDKQLSIRTYSKMDLDIWKYEDVRKWFNQNGPCDENVMHKSPSETGYTIAR